MFFQVFLKHSLAGAWLQPKDYSQIIYQFIIDDLANEKIDHNSHSAQRTHYSLYLEYGLAKNLTVGCSTLLTQPVSHHTIDYKFNTVHRVPNFTELFVRLPLFSGHNTFFSVQFLTKLPINYHYLRDSMLYPQGQIDYEARLQLGVGLSKYNWLSGNFASIANIAKGHKGFLNIALAMRYRKDLPFNEIRGEVTYGFPMFSKYMLIMSLYKTLQIDKFHTLLTDDDAVSVVQHFSKWSLTIAKGVGQQGSSALSLSVFVSSRRNYELGVMLGWWWSFGQNNDRA